MAINDALNGVLLYAERAGLKYPYEVTLEHRERGMTYIVVAKGAVPHVLMEWGGSDPDEPEPSTRPSLVGREVNVATWEKGREFRGQIAKIGRG